MLQILSRFFHFICESRTGRRVVQGVGVAGTEDEEEEEEKGKGPSPPPFSMRITRRRRKKERSKEKPLLESQRGFSLKTESERAKEERKSRKGSKSNSAKNLFQNQGFLDSLL